MSIKKPVLLAEQTTEFSLNRGETTESCNTISWCPYCETYHMHGWIKGERGLSHRRAHCSDIKGKSPLRETGYWLKFRPFKSHPKQTIK